MAMNIKDDNELRFVLDSKNEFYFQNEDKAIAIVTLENGNLIPISVREHRGQFHVEGHTRFKIPGKEAFSAYDEFATSDKDLFSLYISPLDGEVKAVKYLESASANDLDTAIEEVCRILNCAWDRLCYYADEAARQSPEDVNAFDIADAALKNFVNED